MKSFVNNIKYFIISIVTLGIFIQGSHFEEESLPKSTVELHNFDTAFYNTLISAGLSYYTFQIAFFRFNELVDQGTLKNDSLLTIIDFNKPSTEERLFIVDLKNKKLIKKALVAHGINSGLETAKDFSNRINSHKSSLGLYLTDDVYTGKHGYSLRLDGLEKGINDNARERDIVMHGASYVSDEFIQKNGRLGRSFGCPALSNSESKDIINLIKNKTCLFIYHSSYQSKLVAENQETTY